MVIRSIALILAVFALAACARIDAGEARLCRALIPAIAQGDTKLRPLSPQAAPAPHALSIIYLVKDAEGRESRHQIRCAFIPPDTSESRPRLAAVEDDRGPLNTSQLYFLQRFWLDRPEAIAEGAERFIAEPSIAPRWLAYFAQALVNGAPQAAILALLATSYALLYGLVGRINLAFGDMAMTGSYGAAVMAGTTLALGGSEALGLALGLAAALTVAIATAFVVARNVVAPLAYQPGRMLLVASIGLGFVIQEGLRNLRGTRGDWIPPILSTPRVPFEGGGFSVHVTDMQMVSAGAAAVLALSTLMIMRKSQFGRAWRAISDDPKGAALCGVDAHGILVGAMLLAGALSGACGAILLFSYGNAHYAFGTIIGLKAVIAAILGGIGVVEGALIGGLALGAFEALWSAYLPIEFRDMATFSLLSIALILRPGGLFGFSGDGPREV